MNPEQFFSALRPFDVFILLLTLLNSLLLFRRAKTPAADHAKISIHPMGAIKIVVAHDQVMRLNVNAQFFNWGAGSAKIGRLEIRLNGPRDRNHVGQWKFFYLLGAEGRVAPQEAGRQPLELPGQEIKTIMMQFEETPANPRRFSIWTEGQYQLQILGWREGRNTTGQPDLRSDYLHFSISPKLLTEIAVHMTEREEPRLVAVPFDEYLLLLS